MNKAEFLAELRRSLSGKLSPEEIRSHIDYYGAYIDGEMAKGRSEADVMGELGSPRLIAKTLVNMAEAEEEDGGYGQGAGSRRETYYEDPRQDDMGSEGQGGRRKGRINGTVAIIIAILVLLLCLWIIFSIIRGGFYLMWRFFPLIIVVLIILFFARSFRR